MAGTDVSGRSESYLQPRQRRLIILQLYGARNLPSAAPKKAPTILNSESRALSRWFVCKRPGRKVEYLVRGLFWMEGWFATMVLNEVLEARFQFLAER
jgi:hypothetical protein